MPDALRGLILQYTSSDIALNKLTQEVSKNSLFRSLIGTTQTIDIIEAGIKANVLPEQASAIVNHRIAVFNSLKETMTRDTSLLKSLVEIFNLTYTALGETTIGGVKSSSGSLAPQMALHGGLEPAPIIPINNLPFELL
ncbi:hypothetical protein D9756_002469 [Leucocoprinus leucothites]|uniref:Peptidase M20 dimerisation domain-containing protein n=1 Tax=Leucocoprinus leucothites TaxID=201217 RepID=A0A8H5GC76_9AGAR|nr:hypothetical protein D9756_002469 [Leucoagaricus leucothites]